jgi:hypothetical protein
MEATGISWSNSLKIEKGVRSPHLRLWSALFQSGEGRAYSSKGSDAASIQSLCLSAHATARRLSSEGSDR